MLVKLNTDLRTARLQLLVDALDADADPGYVELYTAPQPATGGAAVTTQTLLGTWVLSKPSGVVVDGELTFAAITDDPVADATGDLVWGRFYDGAGNFVMDGDAGTAASTALLRFNTLSVLAGGLIEALGGTLTEGGG